MQASRDALAAQNAALKRELSAFDKSFFDEIEDLKYRHKRTLEVLEQTQDRNKQLQEELARVLRGERAR